MWLHPLKYKGGGNSYGVCRGLDQGGKLFKIFRLLKIKNALSYMKQIIREIN